MKIIIGLGNPGKQYEGTRHNIGFEIVEKLQKDFDFPEFTFNKKFNAEISEGNYLPHRQAGKLPASSAGGKTENHKLILVKPQTFMNLSGTAVRAMLDFYKLAPEEIIVIQDEVDIEIGTFKISTDSRSAGHNGIQNIIDNLSTQKFTRLRIGIGRKTETDTPSCRMGVHPPRVDERSPRVEAGDFVLERFSPEENEKINHLTEDIQEALKKLL
ncbi:MAG TPA: aminoacyl-tRNA hydrolase [Candidatus Moranbacteria bacterium]|nr:aminoacyl-tRNA hydrolase [Candidatus Moranbacteria bacterium]